MTPPDKLLSQTAATKSGNVAQNKSKEAEIDPIAAYTMFGNIRKPKRSPFHYTDRKSGTGYSDFSTTIYQNRPYIWPPLRKLFNVNFAIIAAGLLMKQFKAIGNGMKPEASQLDNQASDGNSDSSDSDDDSGEESKKVEKPKKKKIGFRERRIIEYEDRIRLYSTPDKIFRYFATLKVIDKSDESGRTFEVFMTPEDFLRSFTPGVMQPRKYGLDSYKIYQPEKYKHKFSDTTSIFYKLGENGLISFSDYLFLMTLLSKPNAFAVLASPNDFALAFKIFDINGDGALDKEEFHKVQLLIMSQTTVGQRHRDHITPNSSFRVESNSALEHYFFGKDGTKTLPASKFLEFQKCLYNDILRMEFERRDELDGVDGLISEYSFGELLLMHAQIPEKRQKLMLKRIKKKFKENARGISFEETRAFFQFLYHIEDVDMALHFHRMAGLSIDAELLKRVARKVTDVELSDHVIDVVITLFDDNMDGKLSNNEMVAVMRRRMRRGLERPRDTGLFRLLDALVLCGKRTYHASPLPFY
ncbi:EF hand [Ancylostoma ceylanicum]|uniref:EF hand n=1 Tax=Ancylostoma ceylanicum TaxID=53326 RepID=A0A0D6M7H1_9BILA|nr:EF hand [Ancylostoma ceylanicum]